MRRLSYVECSSRIFNNGFYVLTNNISGIYDKITIKCKKCGRVFETSVKRAYLGGCARCSRKETLSIPIIQSRIKDKQIKLLSAIYENSHSKLLWQCLICKSKFYMSWDNIRGGHGCNICGRHCGKDNYRWRGGISPRYPPEFSEKLKIEIRNRDEHKCQYPNCSYSDIIQLKKLHIHHIDTNKNNNLPKNLVSLCSKHHKMVEGIVEWENYFTYIVSDYEYRK